MTVKKSYQNFIIKLQEVQAEGEAKAIARIVFEDVFKLYDYESVRPFSEEDEMQLDGILTRLLQNEPVQYILGVADFYGYKFKVNPHVLIPRQDTEELVYFIENSVKEFFGKKEIRLLDIGTGSGCIPISLKKKLSQAEIFALDVDENALGVAKENAKLLATPITFFQKNILEKEGWASLPRFEIIVSNPPYIPNREADLMPENVKQFEPHLALFVEDDDPLVFYRTIAEFAFEKLEKGGFLFFETNEFNASEVLSMLHNNKFTDVILEKDLDGKDRMIRARKS